MAGVLAPYPVNSPPGSFIWTDWYRQLQDFMTGVSTISWTTLDKTGSNLTDIEQRNHNDLQNIQGGSDGERYHLTQAQFNSLPGTFVTSFIQLNDVPNTYAGSAGKVVTVNPSANGLIFSTLPPSGVQNIVAGTGISVNNSDPANPIVSATGSGGGVLPVVNGDVPPVLVYLDDGSLVYTEIV